MAQFRRKGHRRAPCTLSAVVVGLIAGCFSQPSHAPLSLGPSVDGPIAVLPVRGSQVRIGLANDLEEAPEVRLAPTDSKSAARMARIIDATMNRLANSAATPLTGPDELRDALERSAEWRRFDVYLHDPGSWDESWKRSGLARFADEIGCADVAVVSPAVFFRPTTSDGAASRWNGLIEIQISRVNLIAGEVVARGFGEADFEGEVGVMGIGGPAAAIAWPYAFGVSFERAADEAARDAIERLFETGAENAPDQQDH